MWLAKLHVIPGLLNLLLCGGGGGGQRWHFWNCNCLISKYSSHIIKVQHMGKVAIILANMSKWENLLTDISWVTNHFSWVKEGALSLRGFQSWEWHSLGTLHTLFVSLSATALKLVPPIHNQSQNARLNGHTVSWAVCNGTTADEHSLTGLPPGPSPSMHTVPAASCSAKEPAFFLRWRHYLGEMLRLSATWYSQVSVSGLSFSVFVSDVSSCLQKPGSQCVDVECPLHSSFSTTLSWLP